MTWPTVPIGDLVQIRGGGTPRRDNAAFFQGEIPWVTPKDMKSWEIRSSQIQITQEAVEQSAARMVAVNSVLLVVRSGILKHSLPVAINTVPVAINQDMKALTCCSHLYPRYLARLLQAIEGIILSWVRATTADNFPVENLEQLEIPLPPVQEQRRIATILDEADALRAKRRVAMAELDRTAHAIFVQMFGLPPYNDTVLLSQCVEEFRYGTSEKSGNHGRPALRIPNVLDGYINLDELKLVAVSDVDFKRLSLQATDVLFVRTNGNPDYVGRCATVGADLGASIGLVPEDFIYASYLIRARLKNDLLDPTFLCAFLSMEAGRNQVRGRAKTSAGQFNINTEGLGALRIPCVPRGAQAAFADAVSHLTAVRDQYRRHEVALASLFASLQHRAFRGEL